MISRIPKATTFLLKTAASRFIRKRSLVYVTWSTSKRCRLTRRKHAEMHTESNTSRKQTLRSRLQCTRDATRISYQLVISRRVFLRRDISKNAGNFLKSRGLGSEPLARLSISISRVTASTTAVKSARFHRFYRDTRCRSRRMLQRYGIFSDPTYREGRSFRAEGYSSTPGRTSLSPRHTASVFCRRSPCGSSRNLSRV